jgi:hypothetical protein
VGGKNRNFEGNHAIRTPLSFQAVLQAFLKFHDALPFNSPDLTKTQLPGTTQ